MPVPKGTRRPPCVCCLVGSFLFLFFKRKIKQVDLSCGCEGCLGTVGGSMLSGDLSLSLGSFVGPTVEGLAGLPAGDLGLLGIFASSHAGSLLLARARPPQSSTGPSAQPRAHSFTAWWLGGVSSLSAQDICALGSPETTQSKQEYAVNIYNQPENKTQAPSLDGTQTAGSLGGRGGAGRLDRWRGLPHLLAINKAWET